jgi:hypothetical protein
MPPDLPRGGRENQETSRPPERWLRRITENSRHPFIKYAQNPNYDPKHNQQSVNAWPSPEDLYYLKTCHSLVNSRRFGHLRLFRWLSNFFFFAE